MIIGTIAERANIVYDEILTTGYSLLPEEVLTIIIRSAEKYSSWSDQLSSNIDDLAIEPKLKITEFTELTKYDWGIIEPVVEAHINLTQARRNEAAGITDSGLSSSEATQLYKDAVNDMKREGFQFEPFSIAPVVPKSYSHQTSTLGLVSPPYIDICHVGGTSQPSDQAYQGIYDNRIRGADGLDAYQVAVQRMDFKGTIHDWANSLRGASGADGADGTNGKDGSDGADGKDGKDGSDGANGADGTNGADGKDGFDGADGKDAYELAVSRKGFTGTFDEWMESLKAVETSESIKDKYEANADTNVFTDLDKQKLDNLSSITTATDISTFVAAFNATFVAPNP